MIEQRDVTADTGEPDTTQGKGAPDDARLIPLGEENHPSLSEDAHTELWRIQSLLKSLWRGQNSPAPS